MNLNKIKLCLDLVHIMTKIRVQISHQILRKKWKKSWIFSHTLHIFSVQFSSVAQSCLTLCDPMNRSTPGLPVHHHLPEFTQTHVHRVHDAIQPSQGTGKRNSWRNRGLHQQVFSILTTLSLTQG